MKEFMRTSQKSPLHSLVCALLILMTLSLQKSISISPRSESLADAPRVGFSFRSAIEAIVEDEFDDVAESGEQF